MSKKKITQVSTESITPQIINYTNYFLHQIGQLDTTTIHFFDESGVIITSGNRAYGNSYVGEKAIEFQRYEYNANFTLNLLHSICGVDYFNILHGPSNGMELLNFFDEAVTVDRPDGSTILERGDTVIMDNCGFHHGAFIEPLLRDVLQEFGVGLIFQPAYSPHFNTCELCFNQIKCFLRQNTLLTAKEPEIAIAVGCRKYLVLILSHISNIADTSNNNYNMIDTVASRFHKFS